MATIGGSRHVWYLDEAETLKALKWSWISQPPAIALFATSKTSVGLLQLRLIKLTNAWRRYIIYGVIVTVFVANVIIIIFTFAQCSPARALWTPSLEGKCWKPDVQLHISFFGAALNILADVVLAVLPLTFIPSLRLGLAKKVVLCVLLGFGIKERISYPSLERRGVLRAHFLRQSPAIATALGAPYRQKETFFTP
ncbi:integral membrane protein [Moelleriella libera RCEF 2490]|uniref:Integral membrane protein n=1 Tax=Moelleriella libera RCEF 2490 TaxID=1081109 RepID=A0A167VHW2_9HYPO|nr:integral membrane protein [Moelleriella libera RCEF 2490]